ncbi:hypothetical protein FRB94_014268 [Tulasnella sp. JGI-2019a]|nr:hypothetical protein FRB94_014268 [Tulasnella sp. JGI-2019a]KAG9029683.1 hypothetical protein FRB95_005024 [Tulasnella sp. JGI-2019a]
MWDAKCYTDELTLAYIYLKLAVFWKGSFIFTLKRWPHTFHELTRCAPSVTLRLRNVRTKFREQNDHVLHTLVKLLAGANTDAKRMGSTTPKRKEDEAEALPVD